MNFLSRTIDDLNYQADVGFLRLEVDKNGHLHILDPEPKKCGYATVSFDTADITRADMAKALCILVDCAGGWLEIDAFGHLHLEGGPEAGFIHGVEKINEWVGKGLVEIYVDENGDALVLEPRVES